MTKRARTALFFFLVSVFVFAAPSAILYSQGYRVDWKAQRLVQTGAFYLKVSPARADISVNGKPIGKTDIFFGSALTRSFLPGSYTVEIFKEGYHAWEKTLEVTERAVTEAKNILLFKLNPQFTEAMANVRSMWPSPDKRYLLLQKETANNAWVMTLLDTQSNTEREVRKQQHAKEEIEKVSWSLDSQRVLLDMSIGETLRAFVFSTVQGASCGDTLCDLGFIGKNREAIAFSPTANRVLFTKTQNNEQVLLEADYTQRKQLAPFATGILAFAAREADVVWLDQTGTLSRRSFAEDARTEILSQHGIEPKQETEYQILALGENLLLKEGDQIFVLNQTTHAWDPIIAPAYHSSLSPDGKKIAFAIDSEIWLYFLKEQTDQPAKKAGDRFFLTRTPKPVETLAWLTHSHLLFSTSEAVLVAETDDRSQANIVVLGTFAQPAVSWDAVKRTLYVLSQNTLFSSQDVIQ